MKNKKLKISVIATTLALVFMMAAMTVYAYFTTKVYVYTEDENGKVNQEVLHTGMQLQLLFDKLSATLDGQEIYLPNYSVADGNRLVYNETVTLNLTTKESGPAAEWGSAANPYVISEIRHLQNLAALHSVGYFDLMYVHKNFDETTGDYIQGTASMPYFLVCTPTGQNVLIDGTDLAAIKPIGSAQYPFIGVIDSYHPVVEGSDSKVTNTSTITVNGKEAAVSTIHNVKVQTNTNQTDVGLFGYVGYLGVEPEEVNVSSTFSGAVSSIQNLLLSDIQVVVHNPTIGEIISEFFGHVFNNHKYTFTGKTESTNTASHEDHHIGIFAGHVSYAHTNNISVYYSNENMCAIDLTHTDIAGNNNKTANYHSSTGIVGFMYNMNSPVKNQAAANCLVSCGGISSSGVNMTPDTPGAGGGDEIGLGRGYVVAKTLYEGCHYIQENQGMFERIWHFTIDGSKSYYGPMYYAATSGNATTYTTQNGDPVTIADGTATETKSGKTYTTYAIRTGTSSDNYIYTFYNGDDYKDGYEFKPNSNPNKKDDNKNLIPLNLEVPQSVWQYVITKPVDENGNPIEDQGSWEWVEAVLVQQEGDKYYLKDDLFGNKFEVTVSGTTATIKGTSVTIQKVFFKSSDGTYYCLNSDGQAVTPEFFREKPLLIANAQYMTGVNLCQDAQESNGKYFYDGVFTFALSDDMDAIESTWENETPDDFVIGPNDDDAWAVNPQAGFKGVVAYIKPITTQGEFNTLAASGTPIFIGQPNTYTENSVSVDKLNIMTLLESNDNAQGLDRLQDNFYQSGSNRKNFFTATECDDTYESLQAFINGVSEAKVDFVYNPQNLEAEDLAQAILDDRGDLQILNLEAATNINELMNKYLITPGWDKTNNKLISLTTNDPNTKKDYFLSILQCRAYWFWGSSASDPTYSIYSATTYPEPHEGVLLGSLTEYRYAWNTVPTVTIDDATGRTTISFTYSAGNTRYVTYGTKNDGTGYFGGVSGANKASDICLYAVVAMSTVDVGQDVIVPSAGAETAVFNADEYVLWPQAIMKNKGNNNTNGTYDGFTEINTETFKENKLNTTSTDATNTTDILYNTYRLLSLGDLYLADNGWQDGRANQLSNMNLRKKFAMQEAVKFGFSIGLPILGNVSVNDNTVIAPVGVNGALANIPTGSIGFRINETTDDGSSIYVIVSVPVSNFYDGASDESLTTDWDYYLGLWQTQDIEDGQYGGTDEFSQTNALQKFELPRSRPYDPEDPNAKTNTDNYILVQYDANKNQKYEDGETYRCYPNGERILVAYRFTVYEAGTYILGTAVGTSSWTESTSYSYPMEIVYCAADGTASEGLDGTTGSVTGSLDYVYDYNGKIVHVQDYTAGEGPNSETKDYNYYYNSRIITYTENGTTPINTLKICPYRYIEDGTSKLSLGVSDTTLFKGKRAGIDPDILIEEPIAASG